jgi:hypothetical protein
VTLFHGFDIDSARCPFCEHRFGDHETIALRTAHDRVHGGLKIEVWHKKCADIAAELTDD